MTGRKSHLAYLSHIPRADYYAARVGIVLYKVYGILYLVDDASFAVGPGTPLVSIDRTEITIVVCPLVPYADTMVLQISDISVAFEEP